MSPHSEDRIHDFAKSGQNGAPGRTRTCDPRLRRPCVHEQKAGVNLQIHGQGVSLYQAVIFAARDVTSVDNAAQNSNGLASI